MIKTIKCSVCGEVIGQIEKNEITENDESLYRQMVTCPNGHSEAELVPITE